MVWCINCTKVSQTNFVTFVVFPDIFNKELNLHFYLSITDSCKKGDIYNAQIKLTVHEIYQKQLEIKC